MKIWNANLAEMMMTDMINGASKKEATVNALIVEMAIPYDSDASVMEIYNIMMGVESPEDHEWLLVDGALCMDGKAVKRVGSKSRPFADDEASLYWEGRCLSMGEPVD